MKLLVANLTLAVAVLTLSTHAPAAVAPFSEFERQSLLDEIDRVTRRDGAEVRWVDRADSVEELDLRGTFQQVSLVRRDDASGEIVHACVDSVEQASTFFGVDLRSGVPQPKQWFSLESKAEQREREAIAARHGMSLSEFDAISALIESARSGESTRAAATFTISVGDSAGEGFNDTTPATPVGGNSGTTLGQQRLLLFAEAARIWGTELDSTVGSVIGAQFNPLTCTSGGAVLGSAGSGSVFRNFANAPLAATWYHTALANKIAGSDLGSVNELNATFNSTLDLGGAGCLGGTTFYYGFDNTTPSGKINLLVVLLHEFAHGLGSSSFTNGATGALLSGGLDVWSTRMFDSSVSKFWSTMTDAERMASAVNNGGLLWISPSMQIAAPAYLSAGVDGLGRVRLFAPTTFQSGSSVSHFDVVATPNLLMEPSINTGIPLTLDLTRQQMRDIGWSRDSDGNVSADSITAVSPSGGTLIAGSAQNITWTNNGGFNKAVAIELSTDSGSSFSTTISASTANTGSFAWMVPAIATATARIRVREVSYASPSGVSAVDFTIAGNTAPSYTAAAGLTRQQGSAATSSVIATVADAQTAAGSLTVNTPTASAGLTLGSLTNAAGSVSATIAASCTASTGTVGFTVSDGSLSAVGTTPVTVTANTAPSLAYGGQSLNLAASLSINPATALTDNGTASAALQSQGTYTGTISVNSTGVISLSNAQPVGVHTIVIRATDNCGATTDASVQVTVNSTNTAPTYSATAGLTRQQGSAATSSVIATVADAQTAAGSLTVNTPTATTGLTLGSLTNASGSVSATIAASCTAATGTVGFTVSDGSLSTVGTTPVTVTANTAPSLAYGVQSVNQAASLTINLSTVLSDNGTATAALQSQGTYTGTISVNSAGVISLSNAQPVGVHTIVIRATDNCGATTDASAQVTVNSTNTAPTYSAAAGLTRQQGNAATSSVIATVADAQTAAGSLTVNTPTESAGLTLGTLTNASGSVSATIAASCTASTGTVGFTVSDGSLSTVGTTPVTVTANTAPSLAYGVQSVNQAASLTINPSTVLTDNGTATAALQSQGTYTGTISVGSTGVISLSNAQPVGVHTIVIRATDNCGATTDASVQVTVNSTNTAPTYSATAGLTRQQGSAATSSVIATVADAQTAAGSLTMNTPTASAGLTLGSLTNAAGSVSATIAASCTASTGTVGFTVSDGSLSAVGTTPVTVTANTAPSLAYSPQFLVQSSSMSINPSIALNDSGSVSTVALQSQGTYTGTISVDSSGVITLSNAQPLGSHTITIRATDNCGAATDASVNVTVNPELIFQTGFE